MIVHGWALLALTVAVLVLGGLGGWLLGHWRAYQECCDCCTCRDCRPYTPGRAGSSLVMSTDGPAIATVEVGSIPAPPGQVTLDPFWDDQVSNEELTASVPRPATLVPGRGTPSWEDRLAEFAEDSARYLAAWDRTVAWWAEAEPGWARAYEQRGA